MNLRTKWLVGGMAVAVIAVPFAIAQNPPLVGGPAQPPERPALQRLALGSGNATMIGDNTHLYILRGNQLLKVAKSNLQVVQQTMLPLPEMRPGLNPDAPRRGNPPGGGTGRGAGGQRL